MESGDHVEPKDMLHLLSLGEIFGGFSHEIAQPLNVIMMASQLIRLKAQQAGLEGEDEAYIMQRSDLISSQVRKVADIIETVREFSRGAPAPQAARDIQAVLEKVRGLMGEQFVNRGIDLTWETQVPLPDGAGADLTTLEEIMVQNLAFARDTVQALGAWHEKRQVPYEKRVRVKALDEAGGCMVSLSWDQCGFPEGVFAVEPRSRIGLVLAESIISKMGGSLITTPSGIEIILR